MELILANSGDQPMPFNVNWLMTDIYGGEAWMSLPL